MSSSIESEQQASKLDALTALKDALALHLRSPDRLKEPDGLATGCEELDRFLFWHGLPKGALSLFSGALGTGATSLWIDAAARTLASGRWVVWINRDVALSPLPLEYKGLNLGHFVTIEAPESDAKLFWLLQELMSSSLFDLIGCDLGEHGLKEHQLRKLQAQARDSQVALVFLSQQDNRPTHSRRPTLRSRSSLFSLVVNFESKQIVVERALHRQTPHIFKRSVTYARFTQHSSDENQIAHNVTHNENGESRALPQTAKSAAGGLSGARALTSKPR